MNRLDKQRRVKAVSSTVSIRVEYKSSGSDCSKMIQMKTVEIHLTYEELISLNLCLDHGCSQKLSL